MSQPSDSRPRPEAPAVVAFELSTDGVPVKDRLECWKSQTGRMMVTRTADPERPISGHVRGLSGAGIEFLDYTSRNLWMERTTAMCKADGREQLSLGLVLSPRTGAVQNNEELLLQRGDLYLIDFGRPVSSLVLNHHELAISMPRAVVEEAIGCSVAPLGGKRLPTHGIGALLASHMRSIAAEAARLTPSEKNLALRVAQELMLALLQSAAGKAVEQERFAVGPYAAARALIRERCGDAAFTPQLLLKALGWSRARLYRLFDQNGTSVAGAIWEARLESARLMLTLSPGPGVAIGEIAFRCGFLDQTSFNRMFKRRYGMTPGEMRAAPGACQGT